MGVELKDFRGKLTPETDCVLSAESQSTGKERQEIVREILHAWALERIHGANVLHNLLRAEGLRGIVGGASGNLGERKGTSGSAGE
ncbi:hypothetical protein [Methylibium sp.]|uniref:hypothetical protein n=1 Tax=Methylibium sp. TaxID=2067992 RepID=UPI003D145ECE